MNELLQQNKKSLLYFAPSKSFLTISSIDDLSKLKSQQNKRPDFNVKQVALNF
ncbi:MAG: hypothetical protein GX822_06635 [Alcaligenaceae bacterium]|nr:hypothetical protein [Alcaligenaceae bacterium]